MGCLFMFHGSSLCDNGMTPSVSHHGHQKWWVCGVVWCGPICSGWYPAVPCRVVWCGGGVPQWLAVTGVLSNKSTLHLVHYCR